MLALPASVLTFILEVEPGSDHADVGVEVKVELIGGAVQQGWRCRTWNTI